MEDYVCNSRPGKLWLVNDESLKSDGELDITTPHHVLYLELHESSLVGSIQW